MATASSGPEQGLAAIGAVAISHNDACPKKLHEAPVMFDGYIICTTPRTGSTLLCNLLASTNAAGNPNSYYHRPEIMRHWAAQWKLPNPDTMTEDDFNAAYLKAAIAAGKGGTDLFGLRLMKAYLGVLSGTIDRLIPGLPSDARRLERAFGNILYVHLTRADKLAQAVSLTRAEQSGLWHKAPDGTEIERRAAPQALQYDFERLQQAVNGFETSDASWYAWFDQQGISPLRVRYETLAADPAGTLAQICKALGVRAPEPASIRPGVAKLADDISLDWMRRYHSAVSE